MAKEELRPSVALLMEEKGVLEKALGQLRDKINAKSEELAKARRIQFGHREAKQSLPNAEAHKAARIVLERQATECQLVIERVGKELESIQHEYEKYNGQLKNISASIKELEKA